MIIISINIRDLRSTHKRLSLPKIISIKKPLVVLLQEMMVDKASSRFFLINMFVMGCMYGVPFWALRGFDIYVGSQPIVF